MFVKKSLMRITACAGIMLGSVQISYAKPFIVEGDKAIEARHQLAQLIDIGFSREKAGYLIKVVHLYPHTLCGWVGKGIIDVLEAKGEGEGDAPMRAATNLGSLLQNSKACNDEAELDREEHVSVKISE